MSKVQHKLESTHAVGVLLVEKYWSKWH